MMERRGEERKRLQEERVPQQEDSSDPWGKRPVGKKKKNKKKGPIIWTLVIAKGLRMLVPLVEENEQLQLRETLQRSTIEKRTTNVPYLENVGPSGFEATRVRDEGPSAQGGVLPPREH